MEACLYIHNSMLCQRTKEGREYKAFTFYINHIIGADKMNAVILPVEVNPESFFMYYIIFIEN